jgi:hypothetical protein
MSVMEHSVSIASTTAVVPAGNQIRIVSVLQRVLAESMRLIELHKHVRWQISGSRLSKIRKLLVERLHALGGTDPVLADSSAQCAKVCRVIRAICGPRFGLRRRPLDDQGRGGYGRADAGVDRISL